MAKKRKEHARRPSVACQYASAVSRAILHAVHLLGAAASSTEESRPIGRRRLVNFLRGCQLPEAGRGIRPTEESFGLLQSHEAEWIEDTVDRLTEEGYLQIEPGPRGTSRGVRLNRIGRKALCEPVLFPPELLPTRPLLGSNPVPEAKLWSLRRRLAQAEGRTAFAIFPNAVLAAIAAMRPKNLAALAEIRGLGEARIRKYGRKILSALRH